MVAEGDFECSSTDDENDGEIGKIVDSLENETVCYGDIDKDQKLGGKIDLLQIIIKPFAYVAGDEDTKLTDSISNSLEPICRQLLYEPKILKYRKIKYNVLVNLVYPKTKIG
jgi:hypothetical protein